MARIVGGIATSHIPSIGKAIARGLQNDPYWKRFFDGYKPVQEWLEDVRPDVAVVVYNDHGLNFFLDKMPTFAVGAAPEYGNADEGWGLPVVPSFPGDPEFSWHLIDSLIADEFDVTTCQEMLVDHAFTVPMALLWPNNARPVRTVPVSVNTVQLPLPTPARCYKFGQAIGRAITSLDRDASVLVVGTGGLSHQLDGTRAGFINKKFDRMCIEKIVTDPEYITRYSIADLIRESGAQGVELLMWLVMRGALTGDVSEIHSSYHVPISNTASAVMLLENKTQELGMRQPAKQLLSRRPRSGVPTEAWPVGPDAKKE
jgi:protocatechuate 4,5-dioxygenase beta chain